MAERLPRWDHERRKFTHFQWAMHDSVHNRRGTSLKWESNGELAGADLRNILQRLKEADPNAQGINQCDLTDRPNLD